jgi:hypothetical protein
MKFLLIDATFARLNFQITLPQHLQVLVQSSVDPVTSEPANVVVIEIVEVISGGVPAYC